MIGIGLGMVGCPRRLVWTPAQLAPGRLAFWSDRTIAGVASATNGTGAVTGLDDTSKAAWLADLSANAIPLIQGTGASQPIVGYSALGRGIALIADGGQSLIGGSALSGVRHIYAAVTFSGSPVPVTSVVPDPFATEAMTIASTSGAVADTHSLLVGLTAQQLWTSGGLSGPAYVNGVNTLNVGYPNLRKVIRFSRSNNVTTGALNVFQSSGGALPARAIVHQLACTTAATSEEDHANLAAYFDWHLAAPVVACSVDSLTAGLGLTTRQGYPWLLHRNRWRGCVSVPNLGLVGQTMASALINDPAKLASVKGAGKNIIVLLGGVNDIAGGATAATVWTRLKTYIAAAKAEGWQVVICSPPACPGRPEAERDEILALRTLIAAEWDSELVGAAAYVDLYPLSLVRQGDGVHFTSSDCQTVANEIGPAVDLLLAA